MKEIVLDDFKLYLRRNKDDIFECMRNTKMPLTRNPFDSFNNSQEFINLMHYEDAMEAMSDFIKEEKEFRSLQCSHPLILQQARFEKAFVVFLKKYLSELED